MKNDINALRDHLFATIEALRDKDNPMDIERAKAIAEVSGRIIDSAKVEVQFLDVAGKKTATTFLEPKAPLPPPGPGLLRLAAQAQEGGE
jgi:hypothetical protein